MKNDLEGYTPLTDHIQTRVLSTPENGDIGHLISSNVPEVIEPIKQGIKDALDITSKHFNFPRDPLTHRHLYNPWYSAPSHTLRDNNDIILSTPYPNIHLEQILYNKNKLRETINRITSHPIREQGFLSEMSNILFKKFLDMYSPETIKKKVGESGLGSSLLDQILDSEYDKSLPITKKHVIKSLQKHLSFPQINSLLSDPEQHKILPVALALNGMHKILPLAHAYYNSQEGRDENSFGDFLTELKPRDLLTDHHIEDLLRYYPREKS